MRLHRSPKTTPAADAAAATPCGCLKRLVSKVKKQGKLMLHGRGMFVRRRSTAVAAVASPIQCGKCNDGIGGGGSSKCYYNYDPLSYSLNFDSRSLLEDEDYFYQFCAFSSRFAAPRPLIAASH